LKNKERSKEANDKEAEKVNKEQMENRQRIKEGKKPFYMKKSTKKLMDLAEKYDELKASGKLEKYLKKKRGRNAKRDRKSVNLQQRLDSD
jgi:ribosomal RNA-processing protein 36